MDGINEQKQQREQNMQINDVDFTSIHHTLSNEMRAVVFVLITKVSFV